MPDTKKGRNEQAAARERRQQDWEIAEARERGDESEPVDENDERAVPSECHRRGCSDPPEFLVLERYQEETGKGAVEATAMLCLDHTREESPVNLERAYADYVFRVEPIGQ